MKKKGNKVKNIIFISAILLFVYLFIDITNFFSVWNFKVSNINYTLFAACLNALVVIVLYIISYLVIDSRTIRREKNARDVVDVLIENTYKSCIDMLSLVEDRGFVEKHMFPKVSEDKMAFQDEFIIHLKSHPFSSHETIMQFCLNGIIDKEYLEEYLYVKSIYERLVYNRVVFFDIEDWKTEFQSYYLQQMKDDSSVLKDIFSKRIG